MPGRNLTRQFSSDAHYHIYNRAVDKQTIFKEDADYQYFSDIFTRHVGSEPSTDKYGRNYKWLGDQIEILAFCWMPNHYHIFVLQKENNRAIAELMQSVGTSYTMYFNKKYSRKGSLFETNYKASMINNESYFAHISRYIHLNPRDYKTWPYSSLQDYTGKPKHAWVKPDYIKKDFIQSQKYMNFLEDYEDTKQNLDILKHELADQ